MRKVVIHHHIFKNAGSSIDYSLKISFGNRWKSIEGAHPWSTVNQVELINKLKEDWSCCAVSSHQARIIRTIPEGYEFFPIIFLRNPIDRVGSCYEYERVTNTEYPSSVAAQRGIRDYIEFCDSRKVLAVESDLQDAIDYIDSIPVFGLVENFYDSIRLFEKWLIPYFPSLKFHAVKMNYSNRSGTTLDERKANMKLSLGERLWNRVKHENLLDIALYEYAFKKIPNRNSFNNFMS